MSGSARGPPSSEGAASLVWSSASAKEYEIHILMVIGGGLVQLGVFLLFGRLWAGDATGVALAAKGFVVIWLFVSIANLWIGVSHTGYSLREELPILLVVYAVPAVAAVAVWVFSSH